MPELKPLRKGFLRVCSHCGEYMEDHWLTLWCPKCGREESLPVDLYLRHIGAPLLPGFEDGEPS
jgi:anaerobic ribonucleoside-triphosphate reductase